MLTSNAYSKTGKVRIKAKHVQLRMFELEESGLMFCLTMSLPKLALTRTWVYMGMCIDLVPEISSWLLLLRLWILAKCHVGLAQSDWSHIMYCVYIWPSPCQTPSAYNPMVLPCGGGMVVVMWLGSQQVWELHIGDVNVCRFYVKQNIYIGYTYICIYRHACCIL